MKSFRNNNFRIDINYNGIKMLHNLNIRINFLIFMKYIILILVVIFIMMKLNLFIIIKNN